MHAWELGERDQGRPWQPGAGGKGRVELRGMFRQLPAEQTEAKREIRFPLHPSKD